MSTELVLVAGGSGRLGRLVVSQLSDRGVNVRVMTRYPESARGLAWDRVEIVTGDVRDVASLSAAMQSVTLAVSAIQGFAGTGGVSPQSVDRDGNIALIAAAKIVGAGVVLMSTVGASADHPMELFRMKYAAEQALLESNVQATIVRATAFAELWIDLMRTTAGPSNRPVVFGRGRNPINFVSVRDVAALVERVVVDPESRGKTFEIGGPADVTLNQLANLAVKGTGGPVNIRHVPRAMLWAMAMSIGRVKPGLGRQARAALAMDDNDMTFSLPGARNRWRDLPLTTIAEIVG